MTGVKVGSTPAHGKSNLNMQTNTSQVQECKKAFAICHKHTIDETYFSI